MFFIYCGIFKYQMSRYLLQGINKLTDLILTLSTEIVCLPLRQQILNDFLPTQSQDWRFFNLIHLFSFLESNNYHFLIFTFSNTHMVHSLAPYPYPLYSFRFLYFSNYIPHCFQPLVLIFLKYSKSILSITNPFLCDFTNLMNSAPFNIFPMILTVSFQEVQWAEWNQFAILNQMMRMLHTFVWLTA